MDLITDEIHKCKKKYKLLLPYSNQSALSTMYNKYNVENVDYVDDGIVVEVVLDERGKGLYDKYILNE